MWIDRNKTIISITLLILVIFTELSKSEFGFSHVFPDEKEQTSHLIELCSALNRNCSSLPGYCFECNQKISCNYGEPVNITCSLYRGIVCENKSAGKLDGSSFQIVKLSKCKYCHEIEESEANCLLKNDFQFTTKLPQQFYVTWCYPPDDMFCYGRRAFLRTMRYTWTSGKTYSTGVLLSFFLGGLGADRFYFGMWADGLGKIFSIGGLSVWSVVDFILVAIGYIKPVEYEVYSP